MSYMNVSLTKTLARLVARKVKSGFYRTSSEVIRDGLRLLEERDQLYQQRLTALRADIDTGVAEAHRGHVVDGRRAFAEALKRIAKLRKKRK